MTRRFPGSIIRATEVAPTTNSASGIWTLAEHLQAVQANTWPGMAATIAFADAYGSGTDLTTYDFTATYSNPSADRILGILASVTAAGSVNISSVTIDPAGDNVSCAEQGAAATSGESETGIWTGARATGTGDTIRVVASTGARRCWIGVYEMFGVSATADDTDFATSAIQGTINVTAGGIIIGGGYNNSTPVTAVVGFDTLDDTEPQPDGADFFCTSGEYAAAQSSLAVDGTPEDANAHTTFAVAAFPPA